MRAEYCQRDKNSTTKRGTTTSDPADGAVGWCALTFADDETEKYRRRTAGSIKTG
jgi:hypothetical protein